MDSVDKCCSQLNDLVLTVKQELQQFSGSVSSLTSRLKLPHPSTHAADERSSTTVQSQSVASCVSSDNRMVTKSDHSNNVILFGLPESSLLDTKAAVNELSMFLIINIVDAFRLGRRPELSSTHPCPLLIKLENFWDRRFLLSSCRKLKDYNVSRLFLLEDLPPKARSLKGKEQNKKLAAEAVLPLTETAPTDTFKQPHSNSTLVTQSSSDSATLDHSRSTS